MDEFVGIKSRYHDNNQLQSTVFVNAGKKEGEYRQYTENGNLQKICNFINNKINGKCIEYYEDSCQIHYICNLIYGVLNGEYKVYYDNGQICEEYMYINGKKEGEHKTYHPNGQL